MKRILSASLLVLATLSHTPSLAVVKDATEVFKRWIQIQQVIPDCVFQDLAPSINEQFVQDFKAAYETQLQTLNKQRTFLSSFTGGCITDHGYQISMPLNDTFTQNIKTAYLLADTNIGELLNFFDSFGLFNETPETKSGSSDLIAQFAGSTQLLFSGQSPVRKVELMFNLANRYVEWAFGPTFPDTVQRMTVDSSKHQLLRYLYSIIWQKLAGYGWKEWHQGSLNNIAEQAANGKTVVYIAGGSDIYQLIKSGVYNIINIDPQLPTQPTYYTNDWEFLLVGNVDDKIIFNDKDTRIIMVRKSFKRTGKQFQATLANAQTIVLDESETEWDLFDGNLKKVGNYTLKRRFCNQNDFVLAPDQIMLMSFNEVFYVCQPQTLGDAQTRGWGIDIAALAPSFKIYVKQLRRPMDRSMITNMHMATLLNAIDLGYISLGSCIN
jgi:hypothetical protein